MEEQAGWFAWWGRFIGRHRWLDGWWLGPLRPRFRSHDLARWAWEHRNELSELCEDGGVKARAFARANGFDISEPS